MTFVANVSEDGKHVNVGVTHGPVTIQVTEDPGHLRSFWSELGRTLDEVEHHRTHHASDAHDDEPARDHGF